METKLYQAGLCILCDNMLCCEAFGRNTCGNLIFTPPSPSRVSETTLPHGAE